MDFERQSKLDQMLRAALVAKTDKEMMANLRGLTRSLKGMQIDPHSVSVFDSSSGHSSMQAAKAIKLKRSLTEAFNIIAESRRSALEKLRATNDGRFRRTIGTGEGAGQLKKRIRKIILEASRKGISRKAIHAAFPGNPNVPKRIAELIYNERFAFEVDGTIYLEDFIKDHKSAYEAFVKVRATKLNEVK